MQTNPAPAIVNFTVRPDAAGRWRVCEQGFENPIADFPDVSTAEQYAMRLAESKPSWKLDVYDTAGVLVGTYNSEDDAMPRPAPD